MINNKKGVTQYLVTIVLSVIVFFILLNFFINSSNYITSEADDLACRAWVSTLGNLDGKKILIGEFVKQINYKCKKENIVIKSNNKEEIFEKIAERVNKCWYRFGEGEYNFMNNLNSDGEWCFTCAKISFKGDGSIYDYYSTNGDSYIEWAGDNKNFIILGNGSRVNYLNYVSYKYSTLSEDDMYENWRVLEELSSQRNEFEGISQDDYQNLINVLTRQNLDLLDLSLKKIDTNSDLYIVYRYDIIDKEGLENIIENLHWSIAAGAGATIITSQLGAMAVGVGVSFVCPPCGLGVIGTSILKKAKNIKDVSSAAVKINKIKTLIGKLSTVVKITGKTHPISLTAGVASVGVTSYLVSHYNDNHIQYVDLLTKEQYYRTCGTEPVGFD